MINIIVVEDNPSKFSSVQNLIEEAMGSYIFRIKTFDNIMDAKKDIYQNTYDLMILDLVLPHRKGEKANDDVGGNFLDEINSNPSIKAPIYIIGLTERNDLKPKYEEKFNDGFWHLIQYDATSEKWQEKLKHFLWYLLKSKHELKQNESFNFDVAIITALDNPELKHVLNLAPKWDQKRFENDATEYHITTFKKESKKCTVVACCPSQMGMNAASVLSMKLINHFRPRYLIMVGIAAGKKGKVNFGDILIAEQTWDGGSGKITIEDNETIFKPDGKFLPLNIDILEKIRSFKKNENIMFEIQREWSGNKPDTVLNAHIGPVVSVAGVIQDSSKVRQLEDVQRKLIGLEMETYGVFYAAQNCTKPRPIPISMKSVTDFGDESKNDTFQHYAAYTSARFMFEFIMEELI